MLGWYVVLAVAEVRRPRLAYDVRRWATVFPLGMAAGASLSTASAAHVAWLLTFVGLVADTQRPTPDPSARADPRSAGEPG